MAFKDYVAKAVGTNGTNQELNLAVSRMFKRALGIAIIITLIAGFFGKSGYELGECMLVSFAAAYGVRAWKYFQTAAGKQHIDARMGTERESEVFQPIALNWGLFTALILVFMLSIFTVLPLMLVAKPLGLILGYFLTMGYPAKIYWLNRKEI